jgi:hypothetical protein
MSSLVSNIQFYLYLNRKVSNPDKYYFLHFDGESRIINQTENLIRIPDKTLKTPENSGLTRFDCSMRGYLKY